MLQNTIQFFLNILFNLKKYYNNNVKLTIINTVKFNFLFLIFIFIFILSIILNNIFILFIYNLCKSFKDLRHSLSNIKFYSANIKNYKFKPVLFYQGLSTITFSTYSNNKNKNNLESIDNINNPDKLDFDPELYPYHLESEPIEVRIEWSKQRELKKFKRAYGGGYLGYKKINNFGNVNQFVDLENSSYSENLKV